MHSTWHLKRKLLCVRLDSAGDVLMTTPALNALKEAVPGRHLTLLTSPSGARAARSLDPTRHPGGGDPVGPSHAETLAATLVAARDGQGDRASGRGLADREAGRPPRARRDRGDRRAPPPLPAAGDRRGRARCAVAARDLRRREVLVEERGIRGQVRLEESPRVLVSAATWHQPVTHEHPAGVGVGHEHRASSGIEKNGVDGLRPESRHRQDLPPQRSQRRPAQHAKVAAGVRQQPAGEVEQPARFQSIGAGGPHQRLKPSDGGRGKASRVQQALAPQRRHHRQREEPEVG